MLLLRVALAAALFAQVNARALRNSAEEELAAAPESAATSTAAHGCNEHTVNFILNQGDATHAAIEDDIRGYIEKVGFQVTTTRLSKDDWNAAQVAGNFSISFSETWGAPMLNSGASPMDDIQVRKTLIHAECTSHRAG